MRYAVAVLNPALAAAMVGVSAWRKFIYSLVWQSVMWRPGNLRFLIGVKNPSDRPTATSKRHGPLQSRAGRQIRDVGWGYALPFVTPPETVLILIDARFSSCSPRSRNRRPFEVVT